MAVRSQSAHWTIAHSGPYVDHKAGDEAKPDCENCVNKGFECRYGVQLTFLKSNAQSLAPEHVAAQPKLGRGVYSKIQFIDQSTVPEERDEEPQCATEAPGASVADFDWDNFGDADTNVSAQVAVRVPVDIEESEEEHGITTPSPQPPSCADALLNAKY